MEFARTTLQQLKDDAPLTPAEQRVIDACGTSQWVRLGVARPDVATPENSVRAGLIKYLLLGGCPEQRPDVQGVNITGAVITGQLDLQGCRTPLSVVLEDCLFELGVLFADCDLGLVNFSGSKLPEMQAIRARFGAELDLSSAEVGGMITLSNARIGGVLGCAAAKLQLGLDAEGLTVGGDVFLQNGFSVEGDVVLRGASIGGQLDCSEGQFGAGLDCDALIIGGDVLWSYRFSVEGDVVLRGASIGGQLDCSEGQFGAGLNCDALSVGADVFFRNDFSIEGDVVLRGANIGGQLDCSDGLFGAELNCDALTAGGEVFLGDDFSVEGDVDFGGASIGGQLSCNDGQFGAGLNLHAAKIGTDFFFRRAQVAATIDCRSLSVGTLSDDLASWEAADEIFLNGFEYGNIISGDMSAAQRIAWVQRNRALVDPETTAWTLATAHSAGAGYEPRPYRQLADVYEKLGHARSAAKVREAGEAHRWARDLAQSRERLDGSWRAALSSVRADVAWLGAAFLRLIAGYGHAPGRALGAAVVIVVCSILFFHFTYQAGQMAPNSDVILASSDWARAVEKSCDPQETPEDGCQWPAQVWTSAAHNSSVAKDYESFSAIGYGFDLFIPLDALGQEAAWAPSYERGAWGAVGFYLRWVIQTMGWVITAVGAATLTGLIGRK